MIQAHSGLICSGSGSGQTQVQVTSTLYWEAAAEPDGYQYQSAKTSTGAGEANATTTHRCTRNTSNFWKTRADGDTIYDGLEVQYENDTPGKLLACS